MSKFKVSDKVWYKSIPGKIEAKVFGISENENTMGQKYAISYECMEYKSMRPKIIFKFAKEEQLEEYIPPEEQLQKGDEFLACGGQEWTVLDSYRNRYGTTYFVLDDKDRPGCVSADSIEEILSEG